MSKRAGVGNRTAQRKSKRRLVAVGTLKGRGAAENPANRFERLHYETDPEFAEHEAADPGARRALPTLYFRDPSRRALSSNQSPDLPFDSGLNPYRGCEHGCVYCYARPTHEYLGFSAGLDFETRILVKQELPDLLRRELAAPRWRPQVVALGTVTDPYQPIERRLGLTRRCLEVFAEFRNPVSVVTKSELVVRDADLLGELARFEAASVFVSITSLDRALHRDLEPRAAAPARRLAAIEALAKAGVPVGVMVAPVIPGLNDHEIPAIVAAAARAGAVGASLVMLRLPHGLAPLFESWLDRHRPERKAKVLRLVRAMRGGRLNDPRFHSRWRGEGQHAEQIHALFELARRRAGLLERGPELSTAAFRRPADPQLALFDA
jgi:DNA repair photolyase